MSAALALFFGRFTIRWAVLETDEGYDSFWFTKAEAQAHLDNSRSAWPTCDPAARTLRRRSITPRCGMRRRGAKARNSCRYKSLEIVEAWLRGYDSAAAEAAREARKRAQPRWQPEGGNSFAEPPRPPREYHLYGRDVPRLCVHRLHYEAPDVWFVSCHPWGIENMRLESTDPENAKREACEMVVRIMRERLDTFVRVTGPLVEPPAEPPFDTTPSGKVVVNGGRR